MNSEANFWVYLLHFIYFLFQFTFNEEEFNKYIYFPNVLEATV